MIVSTIFHARHSLSTQLPSRTHSRTMIAAATQAKRVAKEEGTIADVFTTLGPGTEVAALPARFAQLKKDVLTDMGATHASIVQAWKQVLVALEGRTKEVISLGGEVIPRVSFTDIKRGLSDTQKDVIKKSGVVVVTGAVSKEEALRWKASVKEYIAANPVKGFPAHDIQAYELYNTKPQIAARTHPAILRTQQELLQLWHDPSNKHVDFSTPISYFDRLRIRTPGDSSFTLGPHIDGGSVERWEDPTFRRVFHRILEGGTGWKSHDPFDVSWRMDAKQDLYNAPNQCSILRCWQGWTSLSTTGVGEGTLRVLPMLSLATAYIMLRPFFRPGPAGGEWELDLESSSFPGSVPGKGQELNEETHPHLRLGETMTSIPEIQPGDQVYWHCDTVHSVEKLHGGQHDSSVFYIPAVPLSLKNASYIRDQRANFLHGLPAPDFPGGSGESTFKGRAMPQDITTSQGRRALGLEPFVSRGVENGELVDAANRVLFG
ncbi:DUF1479-domain-containing protein [Suillus clintonianus]|uniref:DUF1479-domain-containing protein n=1 Tax=Suillus clintonianus TaxID=1904413 RepID=UPI001B85CE89|nr:DUF1479-domain-containing protein [Suillus clintonianus]KAG2121235.1 DUF1479-domain-containing protein [Suillus clintonianus]